MLFLDMVCLTVALALPSLFFGALTRISLYTSCRHGTPLIIFLDNFATKAQIIFWIETEGEKES
jgi:hypothetical protein